MKKKLISLIMVLAMLMSFVPMVATAAKSGTYGDYIEWSYENKTLTITGIGYINIYEDTNSPWYNFLDEVNYVVLGYGITAIGSCGSNTTYSLTDGILSISGNGEIEGIPSRIRNIDEVVIEDGITKIGNYAFFGCASFNITIADSVVDIGERAFTNCRYIKNLTIPSSVVSIGSRAFEGCTSLTTVNILGDVESVGFGLFVNCENITEVTIGERVTQVLPQMFATCLNLSQVVVDADNKNYSSNSEGILFNKYKTSLVLYPRGKKNTSYDIPRNVTQIERMAFYGCGNLKEITIPNNVRNIEGAAFSSCSSLVSITIPEGISNIAGSTFSLCSSLVNIKIPSSLKSIGVSAFSSCFNLSNVYYSGTKSNWDKINIGSGNDLFANAILHCKPYIANYPSQLIDNASLQFDYSDNYFIGNNGYTYNHDLARASLALELSSFTATEGGASANVRDVYRQLGFSAEDNNIVCYNYDIDLSDNSDKVAYSFARKELYDGSTLVAVVVRGGGYGAEWRSNVHVGSGDMHYGFQLPALNVYADLLEYTKDIDKSNLKLWITGYSRGAAVANILSGRINEDNLIDRKNLYSYLFAVPKGVKVAENDANNPMHNNIYNIVLPYDVVPTLAFEKWGFGRYGQTLMVKNIDTSLESTGMLDVLSHEQYFFKHTENEKRYAIGKSQTKAAIKVSNAICNFAGDQTEYATLLQGFFMDIVEWAMCREDSLSEFINERYSVSGATWQEMKNLATDYIVNSDSMIKFVGTDKIRLEDVICLMYLNGIDVYNDVYDNVYGKIGKAIKVINTSILNVGDTTEAHNPEYYIAWLYGYDNPGYIYESSDYKKLTIACPVNVNVYDSADTLVASVVNNEVVVDILPIDVIGESAEIYFYEGEDIDDYTIEIEAYDEGNVNYSVTEYENNGVETRKINYANIPVSIGTKLSGNVPKGQKLEAELYNLTSVTDGEETSVAFTDDLTGEDLQNLTVDVTVEGDGVANDIYFATKGELVVLEATPYHDATFLGWYDETDTLLSTDSSYSFVLTDNMNVTAKFTKCTSKIQTTEIPCIKGNIVNVKALISAGKDIEGRSVIAIYSNDNRLIDARIIDVSLSEDDEFEIDEQFDISEAKDTPSYVKLFVWNGMQPMALPVSSNIISLSVTEQ